MKKLEKLLNKHPETEKFVTKSMDIADQISQFLVEKNWTQKEFARRMGKQESEISKWLSGQHNFTIKTITNIETVFGKNLIWIPQYLAEYVSVEDLTRILKEMKSSKKSRKTNHKIQPSIIENRA